MNLTADKIERLLFVKYLLSQAEKQKSLERPLSSTTILTLHDLVECFLQLTYEHLTQKNKLTSNNILDIYSEEINKVLQEKQKPLINKAFIKRLNELRNQLKHSTIFIDKKNVENLYSETETFLLDFNSIIFDISLDDISLAQLISNELLKDYLLQAEKLLKQEEFHLAIISIGKAFSEYEQIATEIKDKRGYNKIRRYPLRVNYTIPSQATLGGKSIDPNLKRGLKEIASDINEIKQEILSLRNSQLLHLDARKFLIYQDIMPHISKIQTYEDGKPTIVFFIPQENQLTRESYTKEEVVFCLDFVIETIFNYQSKGYA